MSNAFYFAVVLYYFTGPLISQTEEDTPSKLYQRSLLRSSTKNW